MNNNNYGGKIMFCQKCGTNLPYDAEFCFKCGLKLPQGYKDESEEIPASVKKVKVRLDKPEKSTSNFDNQTVDDVEIVKQEPKKQDSKFKQWWSKRSKFVKVLFVIGSIIVGGLILFALVMFLRAFGLIIYGLLVVIGAIMSLSSGSKEERRNARKTLIKMLVVIVVIAVAVVLIIFNQDTVDNMIRPGYSVRDSYLVQYSEKITIETAFNSFFDNPQWSYYKEKDYSYVGFTGVCLYDNIRADVHIIFKITGENFVVDSLEVNGTPILVFYWEEFFETVYDEYKTYGRK